ncbi:hypothetical protein [Solidesulfovibrio sp.]
MQQHNPASPLAIAEAGGASRPRLRSLNGNPGCTPVAAQLTVTRLGPGRWRIDASRTGVAGCPGSLEIYLSPAEGGVIRAAHGEEGLDIRIEGVLGEAGVTNLGDCLVAALEHGVGRIGLCLDEPGQAVPVAAEGMLESLGRYAARQDNRPGLSVCGEGPAVGILSQAYARGLGRAHSKRRTAGSAT